MRGVVAPHGLKLLIVGVAKTVKLVLLATVTPLAVTDTVPLVAPVGTTATMDVVLHVETVAVVPLNFTVPVVVPKFVPAIVTDAPTAPEAGDRLLIVGVPRTVNELPALATPPTVTTTLPVVAPEGTFATIDPVAQLVIGVAVVPLNFTVLEPCVEPKFVPVIVTDAPIAPEVGERLVIVGVAALPIVDAPIIVKAMRIRENREVVRDERFIQKPFLHGECTPLPCA